LPPRIVKPFGNGAVARRRAQGGPLRADSPDKIIESNRTASPTAQEKEVGEVNAEKKIDPKISY